MVVTFSLNCDADWRIAESLSTLHAPIFTVLDQTKMCDKIRCISKTQNVYQTIWLPLVGDLGNVTKDILKLSKFWILIKFKYLFLKFQSVRIIQC